LYFRKTLKNMSRGWEEDELLELSKDWNLTPAEDEALRQLKDLLADIDHWRNWSDTVMRFLKACNGDVKATEDRFRKQMQWRKDNDVDNIAETYQPPAEIMEYFPAGAILEGSDKDGDPVYLGRTGAIDIVGLLKRYGKEEIMKYCIWNKEMISNGDWVKERRKKIGRFKLATAIEDFEGLSRKVIFSLSAMQLFKEVRDIDQYYPNTVKRVIILRAPKIFKHAYAITQVFVSPDIKDKMIITDANNYLEVLDKYVDRAVLPSEICDEGKGRAFEGLNNHFKGGVLPVQTKT